MTLSSLIRRGGLSDVATATQATVATVPAPASRCVATVATVAVASPQESHATLTNPRSLQLREQSRQARDWDALYAILDEAQMAYDSGDVTCEEVESLAGYAAGRSLEVPEHAESEHLSELLARQPIVRVRSRLLGEVVVWVADAAEVPEGTADVVYREAELGRLVGRSPAEVRAIQATKRALDGALEDDDERSGTQR